MNKIFLSLAVVMLAGSISYGQEPYKVIAPLSNVEEGDTIYLVNYDTSDRIDSAVVFDHSAVFKGSIDEPVLAMIVTKDNKRQGNLILESGTIALNPQRRAGVGTMLNDSKNVYSDSIKALENVYEKTSDEENRHRIFEDVLKLRKKTIEENNDNPLGMIAAMDIFFEIDKDEFIELMDGYPELKKYKRIGKMLETVNKIKATSPGAKMLDFEVAYGDSIYRLSDYVGKGKYVLVDFWASWCGPCMREIRNLKEIYKDYAGRDDFEILGVAVWDEPDSSKGAIERQQIPWTCILNAQTIPTDLYGIMGIPCIILFSPDGTIILRDVYGADLKSQLAEILGK